MATQPFQSTFPNAHGVGLTKREFFALMILHSMMISGKAADPTCDAVQLATSLIRELNKVEDHERRETGYQGGGMR